MSLGRALRGFPALRELMAARVMKEKVIEYTLKERYQPHMDQPDANNRQMSHLLEPGTATNPIRHRNPADIRN